MGFFYKLLFSFFIPSIIVQGRANKVKFNLISKLFVKLFLLIVESVPSFLVYNTVIGSFVFDNHYQVAKNYTLTEHLIVPEILVFSRKTWDSLSKDDQALIRKFAGEAQADERVLWTAYEKQAMDKAQTGGVQIVATIDKQPFQDAVKPVWDKYGPRFAELVKRIQAIS